MLSVKLLLSSALAAAFLLLWQEDRVPVADAHWEAFAVLNPQHSGKCMDVSGGSASWGAKIVQWRCHGGANQQVYIVDTPDGWHQIKFKHSGLCLDVPGSGDGVQLVQWSCHTGDNQKFSVASCSGCTDLIKAKHSQKCVDVYNASTADGAAVIQYWCHGWPNQQWALRDTYAVGLTPFAGYWGNSSYRDTHPSLHHLVECEPEVSASYDYPVNEGNCNSSTPWGPGGDWSVDFYNVPGTQVKFWGYGVGTPQANITAQVWAIAATCGAGASAGGWTVFVNVHTNGEWEGWVSFGHLDGVQVSPGDWIGGGTVLGTLKRWPKDENCYNVETDQGVHTHMEMFNRYLASYHQNLTYACYVSHSSSPGVWLGNQIALGHIGRTMYTGLQSPCQ